MSFYQRVLDALQKPGVFSTCTPEMLSADLFPIRVIECIKCEFRGTTTQARMFFTELEQYIIYMHYDQKVFTLPQYNFLGNEIRKRIGAVDGIIDGDIPPFSEEELDTMDSWDEQKTINPVTRISLLMREHFRYSDKAVRNLADGTMIRRGCTIRESWRVQKNLHRYHFPIIKHDEEILNPDIGPNIALILRDVTNFCYISDMDDLIIINRFLEEFKEFLSRRPVRSQIARH